MSYRLLQVNETLQRELSRILAENPVAEESLVTITRVLTSPDLRQAMVWTTVFNNLHPKKIITLLNERSLEYYSLLSKRVKIKYVPKLQFKLDNQIDELSQIDVLLDKINKKNLDET